MKNREVINSYIDKWIEDYNNRQRPVWNYEDGCVMLGAQYLYELITSLFFISLSLFLSKDCLHKLH